jgi:hypothetical protein
LIEQSCPKVVLQAWTCTDVPLCSQSWVSNSPWEAWLKRKQWAKLGLSVTAPLVKRANEVWSPYYQKGTLRERG